jgi:hypothetical protein
LSITLNAGVKTIIRIIDAVTMVSNRLRISKSYHAPLPSTRMTVISADPLA